MASALPITSDPLLRINLAQDVSFSEDDSLAFLRLTTFCKTGERAAFAEKALADTRAIFVIATPTIESVMCASMECPPSRDFSRVDIVSAAKVADKIVSFVSPFERPAVDSYLSAETEKKLFKRNLPIDEVPKLSKRMPGKAHLDTKDDLMAIAGTVESEYSFPNFEKLNRCLRDRLLRLEMPYFSENEFAEAVCTLMAERFGSSQRNDTGVTIGVMCILEDLSKGVDGFSGEKLPKNKIPVRFLPQLQMILENELRSCGKKSAD